MRLGQERQLVIIYMEYTVVRFVVLKVNLAVAGRHI